jgi:hypothetical protein
MLLSLILMGLLVFLIRKLFLNEAFELFYISLIFFEVRNTTIIENIAIAIFK